MDENVGCWGGGGRCILVRGAESGGREGAIYVLVGGLESGGGDNVSGL